MSKSQSGVNSMSRRFVVLSIAAAAVVAAIGSGSARTAQARAFVSPSLVAAAQAHPDKVFRVIVQGAKSERTVLSAIKSGSGVVRRTLDTVNGASATVTGAQLVTLSRANGVAAISLDRPVHLLGTSFSNSQQWTAAADAQQQWGNAPSTASTPAIAIVDSGIDANRADFSNGARVVGQTTIVTNGTVNSPGDGYGHGTFVAGIAAGSASGYAGAAPTAPLVSIDVMNDQGMALTSDVIAACDWIIAHKAQYNIGVANFSLHSTAPASLFWDPLDKAVEKLWFDGVVVVAASGNYGVNGAPTTVAYAPGNDPFVITVGADDIGGNVSTNNDVAAPWSTYGYTFDGFAKPEIAAPGRYMIGPVPATSTLPVSRPTDVTAPGYIQLSGTSFAAPVVSGAAAYILAAHPSWTPDQVKGALMLSAKNEPSATPMSVGVGLADAKAAAALTSAPNANAGIDQFVTADPNGGSLPVFDSAAWQAAATANPAWNTAAWGSAAWGSAAWGSAAWGSAAWGSAAWGSAAWGSAAWGSSSLAQSLASAAWGSAAWGSAAWGSSAVADTARTP